MWPAEPPTFTADEAAEACARGIRDKDLRAAVRRAVRDFAANSATFQAAMRDDVAHRAESSHYPVPGLSNGQLRWLYEKQFARRRSPARQLYSRILDAAPFDLCPYCRHSQAKTLDHFIPKSVIPQLSIEPWNLVPCCHQCNHELGDDYSRDATEQMLHPYFFLETGRWLRATVMHTSPVSVSYYAEPSEDLDKEIAAKIIYSFEKLQLARLFAVMSATELAGLPRFFATRRLPANQISAYLSEVGDQAFSTGSNERRGAMYEALAADEWYCAEGYRS